MVGTWARTALFLGCIVCTGCASSISSEATLAKRLADRGPVPVSADNPFIASNLLLNKEMERSPELKGFIDHRGQPAALEVERSLLGALRMTLFYPDKGERYALERVDSTWVISGPFQGAGAKSPSLAPMVGSGAVAPTPVDVAADKPTESESLPSAPTLVTVDRIVPPAPLVTVAATESTEKAFRSPATPLTAPDDTAHAALKHPSLAGVTNPPAMHLPENRAETLAKLIKDAAGRTAEITPRGDIVHYVTHASETISLIAEWYTDSPLNGPRIARMNGRRPNDEPAIGDSVVIPSYLVTNNNRLTDEAFSALTGSLGNSETLSSGR